jgi:hypothetical protein
MACLAPIESGSVALKVVASSISVNVHWRNNNAEKLSTDKKWQTTKTALSNCNAGLKARNFAWLGADDS